MCVKSIQFSSGIHFNYGHVSVTCFTFDSVGHVSCFTGGVLVGVAIIIIN